MAGTHIDKHVPRGVMAAFLVVALVMVALPSVGMVWARTDSTTENRELAAAPTLLAEDGSFNIDVLDEAGTYFNDHFAYRNLLVAVNAHLRAALGASATDQVIVGIDEWLYYGGTLNDYVGRSELADRALACIAHNLKLTQGYAQSKGAVFAFTIAPNKNTLYDENMPSFYVRAPGASNAERLQPFLEAAGVNYVDMFDALSGQEDVLYLRRDTHWDNRGALLAANELLASVGHAPIGADPATATLADDFVGDLQYMLYPGEGRTEPNWYFEGFHPQASADSSTIWSYAEGDDPADSLVKTSSGGSAADVGGVGADAGGAADAADTANMANSEGAANASEGADAAPSAPAVADTAASRGAPAAAGADANPGAVASAGAALGIPTAAGSLYMFRDSFGNALVPFFAGAFEQATFSKLVPYNVPAAVQSGSSAIIIERAERHIPDLASMPPIMPSPQLRLANGLPEGAREIQATFDVASEGAYWVVRGRIGEQLAPDDRLYLVVQRDASSAQPLDGAAVYDPFWTYVADDAGSFEGEDGLVAYIASSSERVESSMLHAYMASEA